MTNKQELEMYRNWFNFMYVCRNITLDVPAIQHALSYIDKLGRSWTVGNGELDNDKLHKEVMEEMCKLPWRDSGWNSGVDTQYKDEYKKQQEKESVEAKKRLSEK